MKKGNGAFDLKYFTQPEEILEEINQKTMTFAGSDTGKTITKDLLRQTLIIMALFKC